MSKKKAHRIFFAINLTAESKQQLLLLQERITDISGRAVNAENLHITLSFLGNVTDSQLEQILDAIHSISIKPFSITTQDLIYWPKQQILALSIDDPDSNLTNLKKQIEQHLADINFFQYNKKTFIPHITLFRDVEQAPQKNILFEKEIQVNEFELLLSEKTISGIRYQTVEHWPLASPSIKQQLLGS